MNRKYLKVGNAKRKFSDKNLTTFISVLVATPSTATHSPAFSQSLLVGIRFFIGFFRFLFLKSENKIKMS